MTIQIRPFAAGEDLWWAAPLLFPGGPPRPGAVDRARLQLKPEIPLRGNDDLPIRDEIELVIEV